ncbi:MAG: hypothetical protein K0V04_05100 [Deltaproteobacteria bacterium]|nr:hypothetical protein [Deltaproteobacteria bacterium]
MLRSRLLASLFLLIACDDTKTGAPPAKGSPAQAQPPPTKASPAAPRTADGPTAKTPVEPGVRTWTFDDTAVGQVPKGFRLTETASSGTPATWGTVADPAAPTTPHAFGVTQTRNPKATYNLALVEGSAHTDVDLQVMVKAVTGELDRGGGPVWRVKDEDNYYIARWNPLENNARFYVVQAGIRSALGKVELTLDAEAWHALRVVAQGPRMELFIDDEPVLTVEDQTHTEAGMIGLWTKADAATLFDDFSVANP